MTRKVRVAVIGGGLGGLCAASALMHHGHEVHVGADGIRSMVRTSLFGLASLHRQDRLSHGPYPG